MEFAHQALENGRMLGIDRVYIDTFLLSQVRHQFPGYYQGFLVGQGNSLACPDGPNSWLEARIPYQCSQYKVNAIHLHHRSEGIQASVYFNTEWIKRREYLVIQVFVANDYHVRPESNALFDEQIGVLLGSQYFYLKSIGIGPNNLQGLGT